MGFWQRKKKKVKIIFPNGESHRFNAPITVRELHLQYPHHYCVSYVPGSNLSINDELQGGKTYLLLPRPSPLISNQPPNSDSRPSNEMDPILRRARTWTPSLQIIAENENTGLVLQPYNVEHKSVNKQDTKLVKSASVRPKSDNVEHKSVKKQDPTLVKSASVRPKSTLIKTAWNTETKMCTTPMGPAAFFF